MHVINKLNIVNLLKHVKFYASGNKTVRGNFVVSFELTREKRKEKSCYKIWRLGNFANNFSLGIFLHVSYNV